MVDKKMNYQPVASTLCLNCLVLTIQLQTNTRLQGPTYFVPLYVIYFFASCVKQGCLFGCYSRFWSRIHIMISWILFQTYVNTAIKLFMNPILLFLVLSSGCVLHVWTLMSSKTKKEIVTRTNLCKIHLGVSFLILP